nr:docking protein 2-like [Onthophagus taurus]
MGEERVIYSGYLLVPPTGKIVIKKSWQQKYCLLYKSSKFGIERLEIYDDIGTSKHSPHRIITLENCIKITQKTSMTFSIITKTISQDFGTQSETSLTQWMNALQSVAFRDDTSRATIVEDNDLYCSSGEGVFSVKLHSSDASERCGLEPINYTLVLTPTAIQLRSYNDNKLLFTWPYCFIRRYGHKEGKFTFEAGRKCETGEGTFYLEHYNELEIFRCIASKMKSMKKLLKGESSPALLDCGDNQFQAALTMEPRSRSPLPPSPTSSSSLQDIESHVSKSATIEYLDKRANNPIFNEFVVGKKHPPTKPPRKTLQNFIPAEKDYEFIKKYDEIEYRSNAWQELGVNDVKHTENHIVNSDDDGEYASWGNAKGVEKPVSVTKVVMEPLLTHTSYDKLNFFGSTGKISSNSGYRQVLPTPPVPQRVSPPSFNDYDEVTISMESVRLADDSHLGYALVRKATTSSKEVDHQFHNNDPYAIISKPKRV